MSEILFDTPSTYEHLTSLDKPITLAPDGQQFLEHHDMGLADQVTSWRDGRVARRFGSKIEGVGLIAHAPIPSGSIVAIKTGRVVSEAKVRDHMDIINYSQQQIGPDQFLAGLTSDEVDRNLVGYNHSCDPNAEVILIPGTTLAFIRTTQIVETGEEVTIDYSLSHTSDTHKIDVCMCGADNCRGTIDPSKDWRDPEYRAKNYDLFAWYMKDSIQNYE
ncbi:MAG TPA: SET domain-containing protein-lysine N-methyltransferase [Patescibacteria group bacterium]|nr:SET domain-containing protein-lysine N-methyltransferase [Patescibacteria group bacterium]